MLTFKVLKRFRKAFGQWTMATPSRPKKLSTAKPRLEWLEERWCPAGGPGNSDTLIWEPLNNSQNPGLAVNWFDQNAGKDGVTIPSASNPVIFDGSLSNSAITWGPMTVKTMTLQNSYSALMTMTAPTMTDAGTFSEDARSTLNMYFNDKAIFQIGGGGNITNMTLSGFPTGQLELTGGTLEIAQSSSYTEKTGVNIRVDVGAVLQDDSYTPLIFTNSKLYLTVNGSMNVFYGLGTGATLIDRSGNSQDVIDVNGGTLTYFGSGGVADTFDMNVRVEGGGNFIVTSAGNGSSGATLTVKGDPAYSSVYLTGPSTIQLSKGATLGAYYGYLQDSGTLETMDSSTCTVSTNGTVAAKITGGYVYVDNGGGGYGTLNMDCDLYFAGTLVVEVQGNASGPGTYDLFNVNGIMTINNGSGLTVIVNGNLVGGNNWVVITSGSALNQDFTTVTKPDGINTTLNWPKNGSYQLSA